MPNEGSRTKWELDGALKALLRKKPLDQIRVRELTDLCGIRRQSFYYHFQDVYQLFDWSVDQERRALLERQERCLTWQQALLDLLEQADRDRSYYLAVRESRGRDGLREVFRDAVEALPRKALAYYRQRSGGSADPAAEEVRTEWCAAMLLALVDSCLCGDLRRTPEEVTAMLEQTVRQAAEGAAWRNQLTMRG